MSQPSNQINEPFMKQDNNNNTNTSNDTLLSINNIIYNNKHTNTTFTIKQHTINIYSHNTYNITIQYNDILSSVISEHDEALIIHTYVMSTQTCCQSNKTRQHQTYDVHYQI